MPGRLQDFLWQSRELGVEVVEEGRPDVDDEPSLRLSEQLGVRVGHAPLVPNRKKGVKDAGAGVQDGLDVLGARTQVGKAWMFRLQLPEEGDHGLPLPVGDPGPIADGDEVAVEHSVDPVHGTRGTGTLGRDEVLGIRTTSLVICGIWLVMRGPDSSRSMYAVSTAWVAGRLAGAPGSSGGNRSMTPRSTFAWSLGDKDARAAMNVCRVVPSNGLKSTDRSQYSA